MGGYVFDKLYTYLHCSIKSHHIFSTFGNFTIFHFSHVKLGNYIPREKEKPQEEYTKEAMEKVKNYDPFQKMSLEKLNDLEDEI